MKGKKFPKNQKALLLILPILAVVAISGCTGTGSTVASCGSGVEILNWEPSFSSVESGDQLQLRVQVQNKGCELAEDVVARIGGINMDDWGQGSFFSDEYDFGDLLPPNSQQGTEGDKGQYEFELEAPNLPEGLTQQYSPQVRVYYHYKTTAIKPITIVNENELRRLQDKGDSLTSGDTIVTSGGPISINVITGKFIKATESGWGSNIFPINIYIQNTGAGVVSTRDSPEDDYMATISIDMPSGLSLMDCGSFSEPADEIKLFKGKDTLITCEVSIDNAPFSSQQENLILTAEYDYYIDRTTTISVKGTERTSF
jgi:hypothetical protein